MSNMNDHQAQSLSGPCCHNLAEVISVILAASGHQSPTSGVIVGDIRKNCQITHIPLTDDAPRSHGDLQERTEDAAYGLAIWSVPFISPYQCWERTRKGPGFDYWLKLKNEDESEEEGNFFSEYDARLEVSGIMKGPKKVGARVKEKLKQLGLSDDLGLPGFVFVAEFSELTLHFEKKVLPDV